MDKFKEAAKNAVLKTYKKNFNIELNEQECNEVLTNMLPFTDSTLRRAPDFSEAAFEMYMRNAHEITFSPACVHNEIKRIIKEKGLDLLNTHDDYKRAREMEVAARFCLANKKMKGDELMIYAQDSPDIILALPGVGQLKKRTIPGFKLEVMEIPQEEFDKWPEDFLPNMVTFMEEKKFNKRYGDPCSLIVYLNFDHNVQGINISELHRKISSIANNPYNSIFVTINIQVPSQQIGVFQVYPKLGVCEFSYNELGLMY